MPTFLQKKNNAQSELASTISVGGLSLTVSDASSFPVSGNFMITIWNRTSYTDPGLDPDMEIVKVTSVAGNTFTIERAQESTSAKEHASGADVRLLFTVGQIQEIEDTINDLIADGSSIQNLTGTNIPFSQSGFFATNLNDAVEEIASGERLYHWGLIDMPDLSGTNSDHDARYYTETEIDGFLVNSSKWDVAYGWGDHSLVGYLTSELDSLSLHLDQTVPQTVDNGVPVFGDGIAFGDVNTYIAKDGSNNMVFTDAISGSKTLAQLLDPEADSYWWDGDSWEPWDRTVKITDGTDNLNVVNDAVQVTGDEAHDDADAGNPIKVGGKAIDYEPDSGSEEGAAEVAANDRVNGAYNLKGQQIEGVNARYYVLDNISTTYDDDPTTATSTAIECWNFRQATLSFELDITATPTDILFEILISLDGTNYTKLMNDFLGDLRYDDTAANGADECVTFPIAAQLIRIKVTCTGTTAANKFTVTNATLYLRN
jgi:hypothetical protein